MPLRLLSELRLADIETFLLVHRLSSITAASRHLTVTPSQVSKAVSRLEAHLGTRLLRRSAQGVALTEPGHRLVPQLEEIISHLRNLGSVQEKGEAPITVAAPSYMNVFLLPAMAQAMPQVRIRSLELPPSLLRTFAAANLFDATVLLGPPRLPSSWVVSVVGTSRKALFGSPRLAAQLGRQPVPVERLHGQTFIGPVYNVGGQFVPVDDDCPLPHRHRRTGHEAQTMAIALELAARSDQLVYGPAFAATHHLERGVVVEIEVEGWTAYEDVFLACNAERMLASVQTAFVAALKSAVARLEPQGRLAHPAGI